MCLKLSTTHLSTQGSVGRESKSLRDTFGNSGCESIYHMLDRDQSGSSLQITLKSERLLSSLTLLLPDRVGKWDASSRHIQVLMDLCEWWMYESRIRSSSDQSPESLPLRFVTFKMTFKTQRILSIDF